MADIATRTTTCKHIYSCLHHLGKTEEQYEPIFSDEFALCYDESARCSDALAIVLLNSSLGTAEMAMALMI